MRDYLETIADRQERGLGDDYPDWVYEGFPPDYPPQALAFIQRYIRYFNKMSYGRGEGGITWEAAKSHGDYLGLRGGLLDFHIDALISMDAATRTYVKESRKDDGGNTDNIPN